MHIQQTTTTDRQVNSDARQQKPLQNNSSGSSITDEAVQFRENGVGQSLAESTQQRAQADPEGFRNALEQAYGDKASPAELEKITQLAINGNLPLAENVVFVNAGELWTMGAYSDADGGSIFLDRRLLNDPQALDAVYAEEFGHHLDAVLGGTDAAGDEGTIFPHSLINGNAGANELAAFRLENDNGFINVNDDQIAVEFFNSSPDIGPGVGGSPSSSDSSDNSSDHKQVTREDVEVAFEKLKKYPEYQALVEEAGSEINLSVVTVGRTKYLYETNTMIINLDIFRQGYKTVHAPDNWMDGYHGDEVSDDEYFAREDAWPEHFQFSPTRVLFHEAFHSTQPAPGLSDILNPAPTEAPVIAATNAFMSKHFGEPGRLNHHDSIILRKH